MNNSMLKTAVLVEMLTLYGTNLGKAVYDDFVASPPPPDQMAARAVLVATSKHALQSAIAVGALMAGLMVMTDLGAGGMAAAFGLLIALGYLLANGADALAAIVKLEGVVFQR